MKEASLESQLQSIDEFIAKEDWSSLAYLARNADLHEAAQLVLLEKRIVTWYLAGNERLTPKAQKLLVTGPYNYSAMVNLASNPALTEECFALLYKKMCRHYLATVMVKLTNNKAFSFERLSVSTWVPLHYLRGYYKKQLDEYLNISLSRKEREVFECLRKNWTGSLISLVHACKSI